MMSELPSIAKAAREMREGDLRPIDLVEHCLEQIKAYDATVQAWVLVDAEGSLTELRAPKHPPLGTGDTKPSFTPTERQLHSGEQLLLMTDGIIERRMHGLL